MPRLDSDSAMRQPLELGWRSPASDVSCDRSLNRFFLSYATAYGTTAREKNSTGHRIGKEQLGLHLYFSIGPDLIETNSGNIRAGISTGPALEQVFVERS
jgi:hypothetical protein